MGCWFKETMLTTVALSLGFAAGCSNSKNTNYRVADRAGHKELAVGSPQPSGADASILPSSGAEPFRLLINLVNVRQRIPAQFLLLSKPQLVRLVAEPGKVKDYDFKKGVKVSLKFQRPESDSVELALLVFDSVTNKVSYLKSGEQVQFRRDGETVIGDFVTFQSIFIVALAQVITAPSPEMRFTDPPAPANYDDFIKQQEQIYQDTITQSDAIAGAPLMPQTDTSLSSESDTSTDTSTVATTTNTSTQLNPSPAEPEDTSAATSTTTQLNKTSTESL